MQAGRPKGRPLRKPLVGGGACSDPRDITDIQEAALRGGFFALSYRPLSPKSASRRCNSPQDMITWRKVCRMKGDSLWV